MITAPEIALAAVADAHAIALLSRDEVEQGLVWSWTPSRVCRAIQDRETNVVVARAGTKVVGFAIMEYQLEDAHLLLLGVHPAYRRKRVGSALLSWLEDTLRVAGTKAVQVEVRAPNHVARAFYAALGYEQVNATSRFYQGVESAVHLVKEFSPGDA